MGPLGLNLSQNHAIQKFINQGCSKHPRYVWGVNWVNVEVKCTFPPSRGYHMPIVCLEKKRPITLWSFNIAMENGPFIDDFPIKTSIYKGFSIAMLNNQMVIWINKICGSP